MAPLAAQAPYEPPDAMRAGRVGVFLDCQGYRCDRDYFRTQIHFVDYVRDRNAAQVHLLLTTRKTAAGGREFTIAFIGLQEFAGREDTLRCVSLPGETRDAIREQLTHVLKLGLVPFVARSAAAEDVLITYVGTPDTTTSPAASEDDPWNHWVFRVHASGALDGEQSQHSTRLSTSVSANRTTQAWKLDGSLHGDFRGERFQLDDRTVTSRSQSRSANGLVVKSLDGHWSVGASASVASSDYVNQRLAVELAPAIEYDVFPYAESTRHQLAIMYRAGAAHYAYEDTTIYDKTSEVVARQSLVASLAQNQPWGTMNLSLLLSNDPAHPSINRQELHGNLSVRITEGLSVELSGRGSRIRDQIYLPKGGASEEDVLLQQRQLATSFEYRASVGLSYTFGSIFNDVVNPRFEENVDVID